MSVKIIGNTVIGYVGGKIRNKEVTDVNKELLEDLLNMTNDELLEFFTTDDLTPIEVEMKKEYDEALEKAEKVKDILDLMKDIRDKGHDLLEVKENSVYMKGINISMPELLVRAFIDADDVKTKSLKNFWINCALNPDPRARHDLFNFLEKGKFTITPYGFFVGYRNVVPVSKSSNTQFRAVLREYDKIKRWKKSPKNYYLVPDGKDFKSTTTRESNAIGNIHDLYKKGSGSQKDTYTDAHTKTMKIVLGEPVKIPRKDCDANPNNTCSRGLHIGTREFLGNSGWFGKESIVVLVNPMNVVAVPDEYRQGKMRVCEYLPVDIAKRDKSGYVEEINTDVYESEMIEDVEELLDTMSNLTSNELEEYKKHNFVAAEINLKDIHKIHELNTINLDEANQIVKNRTI